MELRNITTQTAVAMYASSSIIFEGLLNEVRELSKKKPEATMSPGKVKIVNRVLDDLLTFLSKEPEGKYLERLDDDSLPQVSDGVLVMVQFETALKAFEDRYKIYIGGARDWVTPENIDRWEIEGLVTRGPKPKTKPKSR